MLPLCALGSAGERPLLHAAIRARAVGTALGVEHVKIGALAEEALIPQAACNDWFGWPAGACNENIRLRCMAQDLSFQPANVAAEQSAGLLDELIGEHR